MGRLRGPSELVGRGPPAVVGDGLSWAGPDQGCQNPSSLSCSPGPHHVQPQECKPLSPLPSLTHLSPTGMTSVTTGSELLSQAPSLASSPWAILRVSPEEGGPWGWASRRWGGRVLLEGAQTSPPLHTDAVRRGEPLYTGREQSSSLLPRRADPSLSFPSSPQATGG